MTNLKTWIPLVLAIGLGLLAMKIASNVMSKSNPSVTDPNSSSIVIVKRDLTAGSKLSVEDLGTAKIAGEINNQTVFNKPADLDGRVLATGVSKGTPITEPVLTPTGTGSGLQALVPNGKRAITLEINEISGLAGNLVPGCRVDVVSTINGEAGDTVSRTVVQNVKVQSVGMRQQQTKDGDSAPAPTRSVTLIATPREAEEIELAAATGKPRLVLRGASDNDSVASVGVKLAELRHGDVGADPFQVAPAEYMKPAEQSSGSPATQPTDTRPWRRGRQVKIIRGGVESDTVIEEVAMPTGSRWITGADKDELPTNK